MSETFPAKEKNNRSALAAEEILKEVTRIIGKKNIRSKKKEIPYKIDPPGIKRREYTL